MDAKRFLEALSVEELQEVHAVLPAEFERRSLALPAGSIALEGATRTEFETATDIAPETTPTPERTPLAPETLLATFDRAYKTYNFQLDSANEQRAKVKGRNKPAQLETVDQAVIRAEVEALVSNPAILAELQAEVDHFTKNPEAGSPEAGFDLMIVPEELTTADDPAIAKSVQAKIPTDYYGPYVRPAKYNDKRIPVVTGKGYRLAFAPRHYNVPRGTAQSQVKWMNAQNQDTKATNLQTATDAEALAQINNLVDNGELNNRNTRFHTSFFRRFDQAPVDQAPVDDCVSVVGVDDKGVLGLGGWYVDLDNPSRALVVPKLKA